MCQPLHRVSGSELGQDRETLGEDGQPLVPLKPWTCQVAAVGRMGLASVLTGYVLSLLAQLQGSKRACMLTMVE